MLINLQLWVNSVHELERNIRCLLLALNRFFLSVDGQYDNYYGTCIIIWVCHARVVVMVLTHDARPFGLCTMCSNPDYNFGTAHSNEGTYVFPREDNNEIAKIHRRFSRNTGPISTNYIIKHPWVMGF